MTIFTALPLTERYLLAGVLFLSSVSASALVLYGFISRSRLWKNALNGVVFLCITLFTAYVMSAAASPEEYPLSIRWLWLPALSVPLIAYSVFAVGIERIKRKNTLSPSAVKETLDNLGSGV
ncbi:MAG TPA: hypothetical protein DDW54_01855, partial [Clostridiales bacterium]|nr:hypothetical protein [Clostridiales bacterium]